MFARFFWIAPPKLCQRRPGFRDKGRIATPTVSSRARLRAANQIIGFEMSYVHSEAARRRTRSLRAGRLKLSTPSSRELLLQYTFPCFTAPRFLAMLPV
jgi:hypothetical protein